MKKSNIFEKIKINKDKRTILIINMITFLLFFIALVLVMITSIHVNFYKSIDDSLEGYVNNIESNLTQKTIINEYGQQITVIEQTDEGKRNGRINVIVYQEDQEGNIEGYLCTRSMLYYLIPDFTMLDAWSSLSNRMSDEMQAQYEKIKNNIIFRPNYDNLGKVTLEQTKDLLDSEYYFKSITVKVYSEELSNIDYLKVLIMVNGEVEAQRNVTKITIICTSVMFILSIVASVFLTTRALSPISESLEKQLAFVSDASHELRTPLAIVQSKLENILTKSNSTVYEVSDDIAISLKEVSRLNKLTNELLLLARDDNDSLKLNLEMVDFEKIVRETAEPFDEIALINEKKFNYYINSQRSNDLITLADPNLIKQLLIILLDNATRYTNSKDTIEISLDSDFNSIIMEVRDTGIGISEDAKPHIFERFYREDKARSRETGGNGLGLSIAWSIVNKHKGKISVMDNNPKGTIFRIEIPKLKTKS